MFRLCVLAGLFISANAHPSETIPHVCACDFDASISDLIMESQYNEVYCQRPVDKSGAIDENLGDLYFCSEAIRFQGKLICDEDVRSGEFLCRNTQFCFAQAGWDNEAAGGTASMDCGAGYTGEQSRKCSDGGVWEAPDRSGCSRASPDSYCGRGSRNADCMCEGPQMKYSAESKENGFKYEWGEFSAPPEWYAPEGEGMVYYCGAPDRGVICGAGGDYSESCVCGPGTVRVERDSRSDNMQEYWCKNTDDRCGHQSMECTGEYEARDIGCMSYNGDGWEGNWCGEDGGDWFWRLNDAARNCDANEVCADACARRRLESLPRAVAAIGWEDLENHGDRRFLADGAKCAAISSRFAGVCRDIGGRDGCNSYEGCRAKDASSDDNVTACARVSKDACDAYTNPANAEPFCEVGDKPVCSWHHDGEEDFQAYCRARDHWQRPEQPCRNRFNDGECEDEWCEWVDQDEAKNDIFADIDRCGRYDNHENLCNTISTCNFECNENASERDRTGQCEAILEGEGPHCRGIDDAGDCFNDAKCHWNYNGSCRCRSGEARVAVPEGPCDDGPSDECSACHDSACQHGNDDYECSPESWFMDNGYECSGGGSGYACSEWGAVGEAGCAWCAGDDDSSSFFNEGYDGAPVGARAYRFCDGNGRGVLSKRCLGASGNKANFGEESGTCTEVACGAIAGTNWSRTPAGTEAIAACQGGNETGYEARMCYSNGEWGPVEDLCETRAISCGRSKDKWGVWPETAANSRAHVDCPKGQHGGRFRDCSPDGHWEARVGGKCVHECYDLLADDKDANGDNILFTERPSFTAVQDESEYSFTCGNSYGKKAAKVISLAISSKKITICTQAVAIENCPATCRESAAEVPLCEACHDTAGTFDYQFGERSFPLQCGDVQKAYEPNSTSFLKDENVCRMAEARATCPLTCNSCGAAFQCRDEEDAFDFRGEAHYCHEANDARCEHKAWRDHCPFSCGLDCEMEYEGEGDGGGSACPDSPSAADYLFSYVTYVLPDDGGGLATSCQYIGLRGISAAFGDGADHEASICALTEDDEDGYYADKPVPSVACNKECNELFPDMYPCVAAEPKCNQPDNGTWVVVDYEGEWVPGTVSGAEEDCHSTVDLNNGSAASYHNDDVHESMMDGCSCGNGVSGGDIACQEKDYCSEVVDGSCFPSEEFCHF